MFLDERLSEKVDSPEPPSPGENINTPAVIAKDTRQQVFDNYSKNSSHIKIEQINSNSSDDTDKEERTEEIEGNFFFILVCNYYMKQSGQTDKTVLNSF